MRGRTAKHRIKPSRKAVRDNISGLDALYRPATEAERILDAFAEGAALGHSDPAVSLTGAPRSRRLGRSAVDLGERRTG